MLSAFILLTATTAGYFDLRWHRIPNWLVALTIVLSLTWHTAVDGLPGFWSSFAGLLLGTAALFPLFLLRGMGAGDVKFVGALGAAITYPYVFRVLLIAFFIAAVAALYEVLRRGALRQTIANMGDLASRLLSGRLSPHPKVGIDNHQALLVHFTLSVAIATWIFVLFR